MPVTERGSVRADLVGGTLDLDPIHLIVPHVMTLNMALSLECRVDVQAHQDGISIVSENYQKTYQYKNEDFSHLESNPDYFKEMRFIMELLNHFDASNIKITVNSDAPAGSGLGGSSSMGVVIYKALCSFYQKEFSALEAIKVTRALESRILNAGVPGYQDYYPALFGGILALKATVEGVKVEQLYNENLAKFLKNHLTLAYSGQSRLSGINNWEVYKAFFDGDRHIIQGLESIASNAKKTYDNLVSGDYMQVLECLFIEAQLRANLFPGIMTEPMKELEKDLKDELSNSGIKVCGAGGGGCFLVIHPENSEKIVKELLLKHKMDDLNFEISPSLETI